MKEENTADHPKGRVLKAGEFEPVANDNPFFQPDSAYPLPTLYSVHDQIFYFDPCPTDMIFETDHETRIMQKLFHGMRRRLWE